MPIPNWTDPRLPTFVFGITTGVAATAVLQYVWTVLGHSTKRITPKEPHAPTKPVVEDQDIPSTLERLEEMFYIPTDRLRDMVKQFVRDMKRGLRQDGSILKMLPSYVTRRPTGNEQGNFLALDLGGTNFRVCLVTLAGAGQVRTKQRKFVVSEKLQRGTGEELFDFFADCVGIFLEENGIDKTLSMKLGFTFSFPCQQTAIDQASLIIWTKGFNASGVVGQDVVNMLRSAFKRRNIGAQISAIVNDTVGTLMSHAYVDPQTHMGVILGTGSNAAYVERIEEIPKWKGPVPESKEMVINMEWGNWGVDRVPLPTTEYDQRLDRGSVHPGQYAFEKMISGMYLGEITRLVMIDLISTGELFAGKGSEELSKRYNFDTANMSRIERDYTADLSDTKKLFQSMYNIESSVADRQLVKQICQLVSIRAARLAAVGIAGVLTKINKLDGSTVAIDGSVYEHYQHFGNHMKDALRELLGVSAENITFAQARDGSGQGAAVIAALAYKE